MRTVYKYVLCLTDEQFVKMPQGAKILSVQVQGDSIYMWAEVDTRGAAIGERIIFCCGTGNPCPPEWATHITSVQHGPFVWHFYDGGYAP